MYPTAEHPKSCLCIRGVWQPLGTRLAPCTPNHGPAKSPGYPQRAMLSPHCRDLCRTPLSQPHQPAERVLLGREMGFSTKANRGLLTQKLKKNPHDFPLLLLQKDQGKSWLSNPSYLQNPDPAASPKPTPSGGSLGGGCVCVSTCSSAWKHKPCPQGSPELPLLGPPRSPSTPGLVPPSLRSAPGDVAGPSPPRGHCVAEPRPPPPGAASRASAAGGRDVRVP